MLFLVFIVCLFDVFYEDGQIIFFIFLLRSARKVHEPLIVFILGLASLELLEPAPPSGPWVLYWRHTDSISLTTEYRFKLSGKVSRHSAASVMTLIVLMSKTEILNVSAPIVGSESSSAAF